jgi:formylmethanofuran dehydrogenase subunit E
VLERETKVKNEKRLSSLELRFVGHAEDDFEEALKRHMELHEGMSLFDLLKFLYQSSLGSFHLLETANSSELLKWIKKNLENTQPSDGPLVEELYGKKWVRLNFGPYKKTYGNDYRKMFTAFAKAKKMKKEQPAKFLKLLERLIDAFRKKRIDSITDEPKTPSMVLTFLKEYEEKDCPPVHHSKSYMLKNSSDYLVIPRSSLDEMAWPSQSVNKPVAADDPPSDDIVKHAVEFHGHLGPFLVLGVRAGLLANSRLGKDCFKTRAIVTTDLRPPNSCFVDGIQFVTGCTMGKCNIRLRKGKGTSVLFTKEGRRLRLRVKDKTLEIIGRIKSEKEAEEEATKLLTAPISRLFETTAAE